MCSLPGGKLKAKSPTLLGRPEIGRCHWWLDAWSKCYGCPTSLVPAFNCSVRSLLITNTCTLCQSFSWPMYKTSWKCLELMFHKVVLKHRWGVSWWINVLASGTLSWDNLEVRSLLSRRVPGRTEPRLPAVVTGSQVYSLLPPCHTPHFSAWINFQTNYS